MMESMGGTVEMMSIDNQSDLKRGNDYHKDRDQASACPAANSGQSV